MRAKTPKTRRRLRRLIVAGMYSPAEPLRVLPPELADPEDDDDHELDSDVETPLAPREPSDA